MTSLGRQIRAQVRPAISERRMRDNWRSIAERTRRKPEKTGRWALAAVTVAAAACLAILAWPTRDQGALLVSGQALSIAAPRHYDAAETWSLSDGSEIRIGADAELGVRHNDGHRVALVLRRGRTDFDVQPGGPRRWTIDAGACVVEVVGTSFVVDRHDDGTVRVEVSRGHVAVRAAEFEGGVRMLGAGEFVEVHGTTPEAPPATHVAPSVPTELPITTTEIGPTEISPTEPLTPEPSAPANHAAVDHEHDELLARAETATREGRPWDAAPLLRTFVSESDHDPRAALAAFTLARMELEELRHPAAAARAYQRALRLGLSGDLAHIARARRVEALSSAGDHAGALRAAEDYFAHHPNGEWGSRVRAWVANR